MFGKEQTPHILSQELALCDWQGPGRATRLVGHVLEISWIQSDQLDTAASGTTREAWQRICQGLDSKICQPHAEEKLRVLKSSCGAQVGHCQSPFSCSSLCEPHPAQASQACALPYFPTRSPNPHKVAFIKWLLFSWRAYLKRNYMGRAL